MTYEIAIIGGGVIGVSIAAHLAESGVKDIAVIERAAQLGTGTTARASGGIRHQFSTEANVRCTIESMKEITRFKEMYGIDLHLRQCGYLMYAEDETTANVLRVNAKLQNALGIPTRLVEPDAMRDFFPRIHTDGIHAASFCPLDGIGDPNSMVDGYATDARKNGVTFLYGTEVTKITSDGKIKTNREDFEAKKIVIATGPYSFHLLASLGYKPPIHPHRKLVFQATLPKGVSDQSPFLIGFPSGWYMKYEAGAVMMGMTQVEDEAVGDETINMDRAEPVIQAGVNRYPPLSESRLIRGLAGLSDATPDHHAIIGHLPGHENIYVALGFSGHGFQHAPIAGRLMAELITTGSARTLDLSAFAPDRFSRKDLPSDPLVVT